MLGLVIFLGPSVVVCAILAVGEAFRLAVRWVDDRARRRLLARYRNVTRVSLDPQRCEQRRAPAELRRLREFYEQADREAVERRAAEGIFDYCRDLGAFASTALDIQSLPETRGGLWS